MHGGAFAFPRRRLKLKVLFRVLCCAKEPTTTFRFCCCSLSLTGRYAGEVIEDVYI